MCSSGRSLREKPKGSSRPGLGDSNSVGGGGVSGRGTVVRRWETRGAGIVGGGGVKQRHRQGAWHTGVRNERTLLRGNMRSQLYKESSECGALRGKRQGARWGEGGMTPRQALGKESPEGRRRPAARVTRQLRGKLVQGTRGALVRTEGPPRTTLQAVRVVTLREVCKGRNCGRQWVGATLCAGGYP